MLILSQLPSIPRALNRRKSTHYQENEGLWKTTFIWDWLAGICLRSVSVFSSLLQESFCDQSESRVLTPIRTCMIGCVAWPQRFGVLLLLHFLRSSLAQQRSGPP